MIYDMAKCNFLIQINTKWLRMANCFVRNFTYLIINFEVVEIKVTITG